MFGCPNSYSCLFELTNGSLLRLWILVGGWIVPVPKAPMTYNTANFHLYAV